MGVTKTTHVEGTGAVPQKGQTVTIEYTGFLKDTSKPNNKGKQYVDSLHRRDDGSRVRNQADACSLKIRQLRRPWRLCH